MKKIDEQFINMSMDIPKTYFKTVQPKVIVPKFKSKEGTYKLVQPASTKLDVE